MKYESLLNSLMNRLKKKRRRQTNNQKIFPLILPIIIISFLFISLVLPVRPVSAYSIIIDNNVDTDSDVDVLANIGVNDSTYLNAQNLDGTYQVIQEGNGAGYVAGNDVNELHDQVTNTQTPVDVGTYSNDGNMQAKDGTDNILTEGQGASYVVGNDVEDYVDTFTNNHAPAEIGEHSGSGNLQATDGTDDILTEGEDGSFHYYEDGHDSIANNYDPDDNGTYSDDSQR